MSEQTRATKQKPANQRQLKDKQTRTMTGRMPGSTALGAAAALSDVSNHPDWRTGRKRRAREALAGGGECERWAARKRVRRPRRGGRNVSAPLAPGFTGAPGVKAAPDPFAEMMATLAIAAAAVEAAAVTRRERTRVRLSPYEDVLEQEGVDIVKYELGI